MVLFVLLLGASALPETLANSGSPPAGIGATCAVLGLAGVWSWFWLRVVGRTSGRGVTVVAVAYVLYLWFVSLAVGPSYGTVLIFGAILAGALFPWRVGLVAVFAVSILEVSLALIRHVPAPTTLSLFLNDFVVGIAAVGVRQGVVSYLQLESAREEIARLAVAEERLRFARDLHDVLGQSLAMIVLKGEVAARGLPAGTPDAVRNEVREVIDIARSSLNDVRETVAGYRLPTLRGELASAGQALRSAGIEAAYENGAGALPQDMDSVLAWAVREGVTNLIKHSQARSCRIALARTGSGVRLDIADDGLGAGRLNGGSGLKGLEERVARIGGTARFESAPGGGFKLEVELPLPVEPAAPEPVSP